MTTTPEPEQAAPRRGGAVRIGRIAGIDVLVTPTWLLVAALIAVLIAPRVEQVAPGLGALKYVAGVAFAVLLYLSILLHEASHAIAARRFGIGVRSISIHFLGGETQLTSDAKTPRAEFVIAVVGPLTSLLVGAVALGLTFILPGGLIGLAAESLAVANLSVGILNLVPGLPLDGGRVLRAAVWRVSGDADRATVVAAWGGRVAAGLVVALPLLALLTGRRWDVTDFFLAAIIASFLWGGATASLHHARLRRRLPALRARLLARRVIVVPEDLPVSEAIRRAQEAEAGGIATETSSAQIVGLVDERALTALPPERRPWVPVGSLTRTLEGNMRLSADLVGEDLVRAMTDAPASEYLLVEPDGAVFGLLAAADVEAAFARAG